jgi:myotubularin-related protein 3/4
VGWLGWRNNKDEQLLKALADACSFDNGNSEETNKNELEMDSSDTSQTENVDIDKPKKILIVDARSYASAVTNRARGGGVECPEYYPSAEIQFMNLANIHVIRKSFQSLRQLCAMDMEIPNFYSLLDKTNWLQHISGLISASNIVINAVEKNNRPVLVHCSDGWDRTSQICSTAEICLDPFYRTIEGFRILIEREWLSFGHKFGDRVGHGVGADDVNERCPVFLQWLDCIFQIHQQYPCSFEFSTGYLIKLAQHVHSCLFGTFLCNNLRERLENSIPDRSFSVWSFLSAPIYKNPLYQPNRERIIWPTSSMRSIVFWKELYLGSLHTLFSTNNVEISNEKFNDSGIIKTRSFNDLVSEIKRNGSVRRLSDPSIVYDETKNTTKITPLFPNSGDNSSTDAPALDDFSNNLHSTLLDTLPDENGELSSLKKFDEEQTTNSDEIKPDSVDSSDEIDAATPVRQLH